jgi:polar amino acid transport system substrate-binding protein
VSPSPAVPHRAAVHRRPRGLVAIGLLLITFLAAPASAALAQTAPAPAAPPTAAAATDAPAVVIPNFWDPRRRIERPAASAIPVIRFLTTDDFPPFNFLDDRGQLTGFNVDLARALCTELQVQCTIQARSFDDLIGHLSDNTADAVIAGIAITAASRAKVDFSDVYLQSPARFAVRQPDAAMTISAEALNGKPVAVVAGSAHQAYLAAMFPGAVGKAYPTPDAARAALKSGEVDASFGDGEQLGFWLQSAAAAGCCVFAGGPYLDAHYFGEGYAIAVPKGATDLKNALNAALQAVYDKGAFADLYLRYFPVGFF